MNSAMAGDFKTCMAGFRSAETVSRFMRTHLQYASEEQRRHCRGSGYLWKTPEETFNDGFGFCYDLAAFALAGLENTGLTKARLLLVVWGRWGIESNAGHFVCVHNIGESFYSIDNGVLKGPYTFEQLISSASRNRKVLSYRYFESKEIPYHISYNDMAKLVGGDGTVIT